MSFYFLPHNVIVKITQDIGKPHTVHSYIQNIHQISVLMLPTHNDVACVLYFCHAILVYFKIEPPNSILFRIEPLKIFISLYSAT